MRRSRTVKIFTPRARVTPTASSPPSPRGDPPASETGPASETSRPRSCPHSRSVPFPSPFPPLPTSPSPFPRREHVAFLCVASPHAQQYARPAASSNLAASPIPSRTITVTQDAGDSGVGDVPSPSPSPRFRSSSFSTAANANVGTNGGVPSGHAPASATASRTA